MKITNECNMELMSRYKDNHFNLAIVDPPYGIKKHNSIGAGTVGKKIEKNGKITYVKRMEKTYKTWDNNFPDINYFKELKRVSKNQIIWGANHFIENISNANSSSWIVWDKKNGKTYQSDCELAYTSFNKAVRKFAYLWSGMIQEQQNKDLVEKRIHPTQKPVKLYEWLLMNYAKEGDKILDTHLGSGSIAIACHNLKYDLTACELDKEYYEAAMKRLNNHTSQLRII
tara:strand:+ start:437 stop:1120 length:684 start_codon:yes stop_codon:yes gene_type:complete